MEHDGPQDCCFRSKPVLFAIFILEEYVVCSSSQRIGVMATCPRLPACCGRAAVGSQIRQVLPFQQSRRKG